MTFDFKETRYSHDQDGTVYDNLVEYCIDFITGHTRLPDFFPFALNRVFREYLQFGGPQDLDCAYKPLRVIVTEYGVVLDHPHNFVEDDWSLDLSCRFNILASEKDTYYADWIGYKGKAPHTFTSGPVPLIGEDLQDLTCILACLLLCRSLATNTQTERYRNNHERLQHGKDKTSQ